MKTKRRRRNDRKRAFTLIELLIVIGILLAIGGLVMVNLLPAREQADIDLTLVQMGMIDQAMKRFRLDLKRWPTEEEGLAALWNRDALEEEDDFQRWRGPYLETPITKDTWGTALVYFNPSEERGDSFYDIISAGPDKEEDTDDDIKNYARLLDEEGELGEEFEGFTPAGEDNGP